MIPEIKPIKLKEYTTKQSKYGDVVPKLPTRSIILGPSGSGKTILLQNFILDIYRDAFERIYIWSPSINVDSSWQPVKKYIKEEMKVDNEKEQVFFENYNAEDLENVIDTQKKVIQDMNDKGYK
jgi:GTPase SAR1 family protein